MSKRKTEYRRRSYYNERPVPGMHMLAEPMRFRPVNDRYAPVKGGRWFVRKNLPITPTIGMFPWHAYTFGKAKALAMRFSSQTMAVEWAQRVAYAYSLKGDDRERELMILMHTKTSLRKFQIQQAHPMGSRSLTR